MTRKRLPKIRRKEALRHIALANAEQYGEGYSPKSAAFYAYEEGYRAAMRDLRHALANPDPLYMCHTEGAANAAWTFARPLK